MTQNLIRNAIETDAVIDLIQEKLSSVDQHVINITENMYPRPPFLFDHRNQILAGRYGYGAITEFYGTFHRPLLPTLILRTSSLR